MTKKKFLIYDEIRQSGVAKENDFKMIAFLSEKKLSATEAKDAYINYNIYKAEYNLKSYGNRLIPDKS